MKIASNTLHVSNNVRNKYIVPNIMAKNVYTAQVHAQRPAFTSKSIGLSPQKNNIAYVNAKSTLSSAASHAQGYMPSPGRQYGSTNPILLQNDSKEYFQVTFNEIN